MESLDAQGERRLCDTIRINCQFAHDNLLFTRLA